MDGEGHRPLWKDPILVICLGGPTLLLALFVGHLAREHSQRRFDERVVALKAWAEAVDWPGQSEEALKRYEAVLSFANDRRPVSLASEAALAFASERRKALRSSLETPVRPEKSRAGAPKP
jgi:hypothetical protein